MSFLKINMMLLVIFITGISHVLMADEIPSHKIIEYKKELKPYSPEKENENAVSVDRSVALPLRDVLQMTLLHHPALKSAAWNIEGKQALVSQSKLWSNPELETELENAGITAFSINLGQLIELGGKRSARISLAKLERDASVWDHEIIRLQLLIESGKQFIDVLESMEKITLLQRSISYAQKTYESALKRYEAGVASKIDMLQSEKDLEKTKLELTAAQNEYERDLKQLSLVCGLNPDAIPGVLGDLHAPTAIPDFSDIIEQLSSSPEIAAWLIRQDVLKVKEKDSKAQSVPDLNLNASIMHETSTGDDVFLFGFSLPLPVWDRNKGGRKAAGIDHYRSGFDKQNIENSIRYEILEEYTEFENTFEELSIYAGELIPMSEETYKEALRIYNAGKLSSLELLSYQAELLENEIHYLENLADFYRIKYDLEYLTGSEIRIETGE